MTCAPDWTRTNHDRYGAGMSEPNRVPIQVRIRPTLKQRVQAYADAHTITLSRAAEILIAQALNHQDQA